MNAEREETGLKDRLTADSSADMESPYREDPLYRLALQHLQEGQWEAGLTEMEWLVERYPLDHELRSLRQDLLLRARIDLDERLAHEVEKRGKLKKFTLVTLAVIVMAASLVWAGRTYSLWLQRQLRGARERVAQEIQVVELSIKQRDAEALLRADRPLEAEELLNEIAAARPDLPGLGETMAQLDAALQVESAYQAGMSALERHDWEAAESAFEHVLAQDSAYKDAHLQLEKARSRKALDGELAVAEEAFAAGDWDQAAVRYERILTQDALYRPELVEQRLFTSYVNAGRGVLLGRSDSLEALTTAETYFRRALALRPQDPDIKVERELARLYLSAQADFSSGRWGEVISALEVVHSKDPGYAEGTARQTLFDAYMARGEALRSVGEYETALVNYQKALSLAEQAPDASLKLFEANLKIAESHVANGDFEPAILHFRQAVETGGLQRRALSEPNLGAALQEAEAQAQSGNLGVATDRYRQAIRIAEDTKPTEIHAVEEGEYLTLIASRYGSTVKAIVEANEITNPNRIYPGQELIIPVLP